LDRIIIQHYAMRFGDDGTLGSVCTGPCLLFA